MKPTKVTDKEGSERRARATGLARRLAAVAYDLLLLAAVLFVATLIVLMLRGGREIPPGSLWLMLYRLYLLLVAFLFFGWFWTHGGQTLGMRAWRLRLVTLEGGVVGWQRALLRFVAAWLSAVPFGLGFAWSAIDPEGRAWHDLLSRTRIEHLHLSHSRQSEHSDDDQA
jgi:uncharacterized RDD family membrane protein YckC